MKTHDASRPYRFEDGEAARLRTDLALAAIESGYRRFAGESTVRSLAEGSVVSLRQHGLCIGHPNRIETIPEARKSLKQCKEQQ